MADYVYNYLFISGPEESIEKFRDTVCYRNAESDRDVIDFEKALPVPDDKKSIDEETKNNILRHTYGAPAEQIWRVQKYGTKTTIAHLCINEEKGDKWLLSFDTEWSPCNLWVYNIAPQFPDLQFENGFIRHGMEAGKITVWTEDGETFSDEKSMTEHEFQMEHDDVYAEEYTEITGGWDYKKFLDFFIECDTEYEELEIEVVKRIKDEDLPLFISKDWVTGTAHDLYESRLKGDK